MNNIFDFKRFGNYFAYDIRRSANNYGINLLVLGLMPVILYILHILVATVSGKQPLPIASESKFILFGIIVFVTAVSCGVKIYGNITDKRSGSDFLMLPASTLEKWISMVLIVCVLVPVALIALSVASDSLLSWIVPASYGEGAITSICNETISISRHDEFFLNLPAILFLGWCGCALTFTLGALYFKKAKVAKTFLCLFLLSAAVSLIAFVLAGNLEIGSEQLAKVFDNVNDPQSAISATNWLLNIYFILTRGALLVLIWLRLRTIKH